MEAWAKKNATPVWLFKATKIGNLWNEGHECTEEQYLEAIGAVATSPIRY